MKLIKSQVRYDRETHTYWLGEKQLQGITGMIKRQLFPQEYEAIPQYVLDKAAERGSSIHNDCEFADKFGDVLSTFPEVAEYVRLRDEWGLCHELSEYIVTDNEYFASPIDKVYRVDEDTFILADIKCTSKFMAESVRWQLSIYAYLLELNNPTAKISKLLGIWLPREQYGKCAIYEVSRIDSSIIAELLTAEREGRKFENPFALTEAKTGIPQRFLDMSNEICEIKRQKEYWAQREKDLIADVSLAMTEFNVYGWKTEAFNFIRKRESTRKSFDLEAFKKAYPELPYDEFMKETIVKGSVMLKIYDNERIN